jgi:hypothetical protein
MRGGGRRTPLILIEPAAERRTVAASGHWPAHFRMTSNLKALIGAIACLGFVVLRVPTLQHEAWTHALILFAALVLLPLALDLFTERNDAPQVARWFGWLRVAQMPAAAMLAISCWLSSGVLAAALALPWLICTALAAGIGVTRALRHGWARPLGRLCADVALVYLLVGGLWLLADRIGLAPMQFAPAIVALTAAHFHYAGVLLPLFAGRLERRYPDSRGVARLAVGVVLGVPLVALGITGTQLGLGPALEAAAGAGLALAALGVAILHVRIAIDSGESTLARMLLGVAGVSLFFAMVFAALYAVRVFVAPFPWLGIPQMRMLHGTLNALGFGLCGVLGWRRVKSA